MQTVTKEFKKAVYAPSRKTAGRVRFEILDTTSFRDNTKAVSSETIFSKHDQLTNKLRVMSNKYAVLEKDYLRLDGSFVLPAVETDEVGWWSEQVSDADGIFDPYETIEFSFEEEHSSMGLTVYFDLLNDECASDFDIEVFDLSGTRIEYEEVIGNTDSTFLYVNTLVNYTKIVITFKKWCKGYRRAKVTEVDFGIIKEYQDDELLTMDVLQELDLTSERLPADELSFTIDNSSREFNLLNPQGFYGTLQQGQEIFPEIGVEVAENKTEWLPVGKYYLKKWESEDDDLTAKFTANDLIDTLTDESENEVARTTTLYDMAIEVMQANNIEDYDISENLQEVVTKGLYKSMGYKNLLQLIAIAGRSVAYTDNIGKLHMKQLRSIETVIRDISVTDEETISNKYEVLNNVLEPSFNIASFEKDRIKLDGQYQLAQEDMENFEVGWWSEQVSDDLGLFVTAPGLTITTKQDHTTINLEVLFDVLNNEYAAEFDLKVYDVNDDLVIDETIINDQVNFKYENNLLEDSRKIELVIKKWSVGNRRARIVEVGFDLPVDVIQLDDMYTEPKVTLNESIKTIEIVYYPDDLETNEVYTLTNNDVKTGQTLRLDNSLINDLSTAQTVAEWLMKENTKVMEYEVDWRQNPAFELSDKIGIDNRYTDNTIAYTTKQELSYSGTLNGNTTAKGGI